MSPTLLSRVIVGARGGSSGGGSNEVSGGDSGAGS